MKNRVRLSTNPIITSIKVVLSIYIQYYIYFRNGYHTVI